jgi:hypothetical protein
MFNKLIPILNIQTIISDQQMRVHSFLVESYTKTFNNYPKTMGYHSHIKYFRKSYKIRLIKNNDNLVLP